MNDKKKIIEKINNNVLYDQALSDARSRLINVALIYLLIIGYLVVPNYILRTIRLGWQPVAVVHYFILTIGTVIILLKHKFNLTIRIITLIGISIASSFASLISYGIIGSGFFGMGIMACVIAALTLGRKSGFIVLIGTTGFFVAIIIAYFNQSFSFAIDIHNYLGEKVAWINAVVGYVLPVFLLIMGIEEMHKMIKNYLNTIIENSIEINHQNNFKKVLFDTTDSFIIVTDENKTIIDINPACCNAFNIKTTDALGNNFITFFLNDGKKTSISKRFISDLSSNIKNNRYEDSWTHNDIQHLINWGISKVFFEQEQTTNYIITGIDMTEYRELEKNFLQAQKLESIGRLAGGVAHDFNNMLSGIIGSAELIKHSSNLSESNNEHINTILSTSQRASSLTKQLLSFSRVNSGPLELIDINTAIKDSVKLLQRSIKNKNITIKMNLYIEPLVIEAEISHIINMLLNLGLNAKDAVADNTGLLEISSNLIKLDSNNPYNLEKGDYCVITIKDNGTGIKNDLKEKIFEPFFTTKKQGEGTGLGLASVYGTVKRHKGDITLNSTTGKGTEFTIFLPRIEKQSEKKKIKESIIDDLTNYGVLLIDDEMIIRTTTGEFLKDIFKNIYIATNGEEGLKMYNNNKQNIHLIILDWVMPVMNGKETIKAIREIDDNINIIISSGFNPESKSLDEFLKNENTHFIEKPYLQEDLLSIISECTLH